MDYDPAQLPRERELSARKAADPEALTMDERRELEALVYARTNWLLNSMRGQDNVAADTEKEMSPFPDWRATLAFSQALMGEGALEETTEVKAEAATLREALTEARAIAEDAEDYPPCHAIALVARAALAGQEANE